MRLQWRLLTSFQPIIYENSYKENRVDLPPIENHVSFSFLVLIILIASRWIRWVENSMRFIQYSCLKQDSINISQ